MKKIIYLPVVLSLLLFSCKQTPVANFFADTVEPEVGQEVYFSNGSHNANEFEWDFGDGTISNAKNPVHIYTGTGTFDVILKVFSKNGSSDEATITINVLVPTLLEIEVLEFFTETLIPDVSVWLYPTVTDWEDQTNVEAEGFTDADGVVVFSHLGPYVYYVDAWKTDYNNYALKQEDIANIRTSEVIPHKINRFTAWVDYIQPGKGDGSRDRTMVIKRLERNPSFKGQPAFKVSDNGWQELYNKSIRLK